jgi:hypothetical protein
MHPPRSSVRRFLLVLLVASVSLPLLSGCLDVRQDLVLNPDGSGTMALRYTVPATTVASFSSSETTNAFPSFTASDIRRDLAVYHPFGVQVLDAQVGNKDGGRQVFIRLGFDDVRTLALTTFFQDNRLSLTRQPDGQWLLEQRLVPPRAGELDLDLAPPGGDAGPGFPEGFQATFTVTAPGDIRETNAASVEGRTARWHLEDDGGPTAIRFAQGEPMRLLFSGEGLAIPEPERASLRLPAPE